MKDSPVLVVGAGFSGSVMARELAERLGCKVEVWDERTHIAGNCHTERDADTGVMLHKYGPHIFNTDNERVWDYVNKFGDFRPFTNRVKAITSRGVFSLPINLLTINQFFGRCFAPDEARDFVKALGDPAITEPKNFEEQALKMLGRELYEAFFEGYTKKQWGCDPKEIPASVLKRLPVRFNYDDNYYNRRFQAIPAGGYTDVVRQILDHPSVTLKLATGFDRQSMNDSIEGRFAHIVYTGPIDAYFGYSEGRLGYRTVEFERIATEAEDFQGNAVINYTDLSVPWTRIHEHKHFAPWEEHSRTAAFREFSKETGPADAPYYPKRLAPDVTLFDRYRSLAESQTQQRNAVGTSFLGRLATYRYMDMETVIGEALEFSNLFVERWRGRAPLPVFPQQIAARAGRQS